MRSSRAAPAAWVAVVLLLCAGAGVARYCAVRRAQPALRGFTSVGAQNWKPFGGLWSIHDGVVSDRSDERGAKLVAGLPSWRDYSLDVDLRMRRLSDQTGVLVRGTSLRVGPDAYNGYSVGLDQRTQSLWMGRVQSGYLSREPVPVRGGVHSGVWYHLHLVAVGCTVAAQTMLLGEVVATSAIHDEAGDCFRGGAVALLAGSRGGDWRGLVVQPAGAQELLQTMRGAGPAAAATFPVREDDWNRMWTRRFGPHSEDRLLDYANRAPETEAAEAEAALPITDLATLRANVLSTKMVRVRGTVTAGDPTFVQDTTAGVRVRLVDADSVSTGDEIEVTGHASMQNGEVVLQAATERLLWDRAPLLPVSVSPTQAASGVLDGSVIEVTGRVQGRQKQPDGTVALHLEDSAQAFTAVLRPEYLGASFPSVARNSTVRVRGICMASRSLETNGSFLVLVERAQDVVETQPPPWWSGWRLLVLLAALTLAIAGSVGLYLRSARMRMQAVLQERERLAHAMHDTLAQNFAGLSYVLQGVRKRVAQETRSSELLQDMTVACDLAANAHREASLHIAAMHPTALATQQSPLTALEEASRPLLEQHGVVLTATLEGESRPLPPMMADAIFRVGMEAVSNIIRHAHAKHVSMGLRYALRDVTLSIEDDGVGQPSASSGFGVRGMQHQCATVGAQLTCEAVAEHGWVVRLVVPYRRRGGWWTELTEGTAGR